MRCGEREKRGWLRTGNFPDGFRLAAEFRGFRMGRPRQPQSPGAARALEPVRERMACLLADCGVSEAEAYCVRDRSGGGVPRDRVEAIVRAVWQELQR